MANNDEIRWRQRLENLESAWKRLEAACEKSAYTELELAGLVQTFEFTFELAWKTLKDLLFYEGYEVNSPREAIRQGFANGLLTKGEEWLSLLESRNRLSHTYDQRAAEEAARLIKQNYAPLVRDLVGELRRRRAKG